MGLGKKKILSQGASGIVATDNFAPVIYTGNGGTQSITGVGFQPDLVWIKGRSGGTPLHNWLTDSVRGEHAVISSNLTNAEDTNTSYNVDSFDSNGFTLIGNSVGTNGSGVNYVAWNWKAAGAAVSNTDGTITSQVSANTDAGFSIATYAGNSTQNATIGHGLTSPKLTIVKNIDQPDAWFVGSTLLGTNEFLELNESYAKTTNSDLNYQILSTTFKTTSSSPHDMINQSGENYVMYTFADVAGYQKVGSYSGTGVAGNSVSTSVDGDAGFQPRFLMIKNSTTGSTSWLLLDTARDGTTENGNALFANSSAAEWGASNTTIDIDFTATGFTIQNNYVVVNAANDIYIYLAIA